MPGSLQLGFSEERKHLGRLSQRTKARDALTRVIVFTSVTIPALVVNPLYSQNT